MGTAPRRRFRRPVFSRLTLAWTAFALACGSLIVFAYFANADRSRVAVAVADADIERFAPPPAHAAAPLSAANRAAGATAAAEAADASTQGFKLADDAFGGPDVPLTDGTLSIEPEEIIITIDGAPAPDKRSATAPKTASLIRPAVSIPEPDAALLQKSPLGQIPMIGADGRRASSYYVRAHVARNGARMAVLVGGLGLNSELTARAIEDLPPDVALGFAPYAKNLAYWTKRARQAGHELVIELPMEARGGAPLTLGPAALLVDRPAADNLRRLDWILSRFSGYFAATNYLGSKFSNDPQALSTVVRRLGSLGIAYLDDTGAAQALGEKATVGAVDRVILAGDAKEAMSGLEALKTKAARSGSALAKAYVSEITIDAVKEWAAGLDEDDPMLTPPSAVLQARGSEG